MPFVERADGASPEVRAAIIAPLGESSRALGFVWSPTELVLTLRDDAGGIVGGLIGQLMWNWLRIEILAVAEPLRGRGWGRRLMEKAEAVAVANDCPQAWLDTFSFQARPFYEKLGYRVFGELSDYPSGQTRFFLSKRLVD